ncbi:MAG TPA: EFR1 family ferrodoxin, partial [Bacteroidales bacterium]|nr:EFR1 family ferrodoxin [Bacteroidales bacterium]
MDSICNWDNLYIYYISGTGNAKRSSEWFADEALKKGLKVTVQKIDNLRGITFPESGQKTLIGFAFPTHGFNAAPIMMKFIAGFPRGLGTEVFLMNTRAGMKLSKLFIPGLSGTALFLPAFMLLVKGYRCIAMRPVDLPSNWVPLHPGLRKKVIYSIFVRCERIVRTYAEKVLAGRKVFTGLLTLPLDLLLTPISLGYYIGGRYFLSKTFIAGKNCDNCGLCIRECPTSSIILVQNRPYWKLSCESCMRCLNNCPKRAIETAHGMAFVFWIAFSALNTWLIFLILN